MQIHGLIIAIKRYNYGKVICIFLGCVYAYVIVLTLVGPERRNRNFEVEHDSDMVSSSIPCNKVITKEPPLLFFFTLSMSRMGSLHIS